MAEAAQNGERAQGGAQLPSNFVERLLAEPSRKDSEGKEKMPELYWIVDGKTYDFTTWMNLHPGGARFFTRSYGRDISAAVHGYHKDPSKLLKMLPTYKIADEAKALVPTMNIPAFLFPEYFEANAHTPQYEWQSKFMDSLRARVGTKEMEAAIKAADWEWEVVSVGLLCVHLLLCFPVMGAGLLPVWLLVCLIVATRTSLAGVGHYALHRRKDGLYDWGTPLFDIQYVGAHFVLWDGHVMVHHLYTETPADTKRTFFNLVFTLPRVWRPLVYTVHNFGKFLTGSWIHGLCGTAVALRKPGGFGAPTLGQHLHNLCIRSLLLLEFLFACGTGHFGLWAVQFTLTMWVNLFLIVCSHEFGSSYETGHCGKAGKKVDWGTFQVEHSLDIHVTGIPKVDVFLTAGLGSHRVHHVLPYQNSGFANIVSQRALEATCAEFGVEWKKSVSFLGTRIWPLLGHYLFKPPTESPKEKSFVAENFSLEALKTCAQFVFFGFLGLGSI